MQANTFLQSCEFVRFAASVDCTSFHLVPATTLKRKSKADLSQLASDADMQEVSSSSTTVAFPRLRAAFFSAYDAGAAGSSSSSSPSEEAPTSKPLGSFGGESRAPLRFFSV